MRGLAESSAARARLLFVVLAILAACCPGVSSAAVEVASDVIGIYRVTVNAGANFISAPLHRIHDYRGLVESVTANSLTLKNNPAWTANLFAPANGFHQFVVMLRKDASASPGNEGDWWPVLSNTGNTLTVDNGSEDLTTLLGNGDQVEIRHLTSLKDMFGTAASCVLNKDSDGSGSTTQSDVIRFIAGTGFGQAIFYHDGALGPEGYYVNGNGPFDGSAITISPSEPIMLFRKTGSPAANITFKGQVQATRLSHYLQAGPNAVGAPFVTDAAVDTSNLLGSGWISDSTGSGSSLESDIVRVVVGTGFTKLIFHHDGTLGPAGWYVNGVLDPAFPFKPGEGYVFFIKPSTALRWRQAVP